MSNKEVEYEVCADGVKEVTEECPFCPPDDNCNTKWCPYTKDTK